MSSAQPAQEAVGAGVYLVGRSKGGQHERPLERRVHGARGRSARTRGPMWASAFVAAREPIIGVGARVAWVLEAGALGRRPSCGRRGSRGTGVAGGGGCIVLPRVGRPTARELRAPA